MKLWKAGGIFVIFNGIGGEGEFTGKDLGRSRLSRPLSMKFE